jgi:hypothetical protein
MDCSGSRNPRATTALNYFTESRRKLYLHEIEHYDLLKFVGFLRDEKKQSARSVYNKFETVMTFLKANGIRGLVGKNDWPRHTEEEPEMYEQEELDKLFKVCTTVGLDKWPTKDLINCVGLVGP